MKKTKEHKEDELVNVRSTERQDKHYKQVALQDYFASTCEIEDQWINVGMHTISPHLGL